MTQRTIIYFKTLERLENILVNHQKNVYLVENYFKQILFFWHKPYLPGASSCILYSGKILPEMNLSFYEWKDQS